MSYTALMTEDAKDEIAALLASRDYYVGISGKMAFSLSTDIVNLTLANLTGD